METARLGSNLHLFSEAAYGLCEAILDVGTSSSLQGSVLVLVVSVARIWDRQEIPSCRGDKTRGFMLAAS